MLLKKEINQGIEQRSRLNWHYAWVIVILTFAVLLINAGVRSIPSIIMKPLETEFSWSRAHVSAAIAIGFITFGLGGPLGGRLADKYSAKVVMMTGLVLIGAGLGFMLPMRASWQLNLFWGVLVGLGTGMAGTVIGAVIAERWFVKLRGLVLGVFSSASSLAQMLFFPLLAAITTSSSWRSSVGLMFLMICILIPLLLVLMKDRPAEVGVLPYGETDEMGAYHSEEMNGAGKNVIHKARGIGVLEAFHTVDFWLLAGTFFVCGFTSDGLVGTHFLLYASDRGFAEVVVASALGLMGLMNVFGTVLSGWLIDRVSPRKLLAGIYAFRGLMLFVMPFVQGPLMLFLFALLYGLEWNATVPPTVELTARRFGQDSLGTIFGLIFCVHMLGAALAAYVGGLWHDLHGNYQAVIIFAGILGMVAMLFSLKLRKGSKSL